MAPLVPFRGDVSFTIANDSQCTMASMTSLASMALGETLAIHWCKWWSIGFIDANGVNGTIGNIGDPLVQMAIHWCHYIDAIGFNVQWRVWNVDDTSPFNGAIKAISANVANGIIFTIANRHHCLHWNHCRRYCQHCMTNVSPMDIYCRHCHQCCHCRHKLSLNILTFTSPRNGANGAI